MLEWIKTAGGAAGASRDAYGYMTHELGHVIMSQKWATHGGAKKAVLHYRRVMGSKGVVKELGAYAWKNWQETWCQAFSAYRSGGTLGSEAKKMISGVLGALGYGGV